MPLKGELGGSSGELRGPSNGYLGSISSLAGSGLKTLAGLYRLYYFPFLRIFRKGVFLFFMYIIQHCSCATPQIPLGRTQDCCDFGQTL